MREHDLKELGLSNERIDHIIRKRKELIDQKHYTIYPLEKGWKVKFVCKRCGNCCKNQVIFLLPDEIYSIAVFWISPY
ncbi:MAG: YkgJ family cysteine cluster protein [Candidatus Hydrothermarchaeales archaeon]